MKTSKKSKLKAWLDGDDLLLETDRSEQPPKDKETDERHMYDSRTRKLRRVEAAENRSFDKLYIVLSIILVLILSSALLITVSNLPRYGSADAPVNNEVSERYIEKGLEETGATNIVAGMILDYRAFDTLGESHVLFTAMCAVTMLLASRQDKRRMMKYQLDESLFDTAKDPILRTVAYVLVPCLFVFGVYVLLNGHLSPGGGFSGGAILGAALIFYSMAFGFEDISRFMTPKTLKVISCCSLGFYVVAKAYSFFTGANGLHSIISTGTPGAILSAGLILPLNVAVGFVVACTMYSFFSLFKRGTV